MCKMTAHCTSKEQASKCLVSWQLLYSYKYGLEVLTAVQLVPEGSKQRKNEQEEEGNREPIVRIATYMKLTRNQRGTVAPSQKIIIELQLHVHGIYPRAGLSRSNVGGRFVTDRQALNPHKKKRKLKKKKYCWLRRSSGTTCGNAGHEPGSAGPTAAATRYMSPLLSCSVEGDVVSQGLNQPTLGTCYYPGIVKKIVRVRY